MIYPWKKIFVPGLFDPKQDVRGWMGARVHDG